VRAVLDANVVVSAAGWDGESFLCLVKMARRQFFAFGTEATLDETRETCIALFQRFGEERRQQATTRLSWYLSMVRPVEPALLGKRRSRDVKDDPYLAAALAAKAQFLVTYDKDLLELEKPFGIEILKPGVFLRRMPG